MEVSKQSGQALLVVVLVMVVTLTVGLSLTSRSIVSIRTSSEEADSQKALAAAEAGIERGIEVNNNATISEPFENNAKYNAEIKKVEGTVFLAHGGNTIVQDDGIDVWLVNHKADGTPDYSTPWPGKDLEIYWGEVSLTDCANAAIEVAVILGPVASVALEREAFDPCNARADGEKKNHFSNVPSGTHIIKGKTFKYRKKLKKIDSGLVVRVVPIYADTPIAVEGNVVLPTQGFAIDSIGTSGGANREVKRSISFFRTYDYLPTPYFMYGLFAPFN